MPAAHSLLPKRRLPLLGLLLSLLLYVSGGVLAAGHLHDEATEPDDHACAVCLLAASTVAAVGAISLALPVVTTDAIVSGAQLRPVFSALFRPRARAPPALLI